MRIIQFVESLDSQAGSLEYLLRGLFEALRARNVETPVVRLSDAAAATGGLEAGNGAPRSAIDAIPFERATATRLVQNADLVHVHGWSHRNARDIAAVARATGTPYVISPCGAFSGEPYAEQGWIAKLRSRLFERSAVRTAAAVTAVNDEEERELRDRDLNDNITPLPYGLTFGDYEGSAALAQEGRAAPQGRCLLLLGPIHPAEGCVPLFKALAEIGSDTQGWKLVLAGPATGEWRQMLEAAVERKDWAERITFAPAPDLPALRAWLAGASILASPSLRIHGPVSILQAIASGVPVLASTCVAPPGLEHVIRVCAPRREAFKPALATLLELSDQKRADLAREARELGRSLFDWSVLADRYLDFYKKLI